MSFTPDYAEQFHEDIEKAREIAERARGKKGDPKPYVEIPIAEDMAERCEVLLEREYGEKIHGLADEIRRLEESDEVDSREEMSLYLAEEFAQGELSKDFEDNSNRVEAAIRTSVAILTEGVVAAPIEGIGSVNIEKNDDGTKFIRLPFFGPIRSAGGTAQAVSVLVADYVRDLLDIAVFKPRDDEVERYVEEIHLYDSEVGMQYCPPKDKCRYIIEHMPVMVDGIPNKAAVDKEVDGYRDLERIEGNHPRDGMSLVIGEGIGLKAPKLQKYAEAFDLDSWNWLDKLVDGSDTEENEENEDEENESKHDYDTVPTSLEDIEQIEKSEKYLGDAIAGRPIFSEPGEPGGFRLRYGRSRTSGIAAVGFSPATMHIVNNFIAPATQIKSERPGKAAGSTPVDSLEGPTVRLDTGEVKRIDDVEEAKKVKDNVEKIIDLGEIGVPYGEFVENNHPLAPASYTIEWWEQELEEAGGEIEDINHDEITVSKSKQLAQEYNIPLHPKYTYLWHDINQQEYAALQNALNKSEKEDDVYKLPDSIYSVLEKLLVPHKNELDYIYIEKGIFEVLEDCTTNTPVSDVDVLQQVNNTAPYIIRPRALTRIGGRMGRPEKSERREMKPYTHSLFPVGKNGGNQKLIQKAAQNTEGADKKISKQKKRNPRKQNKKEKYEGKGNIKANLANRINPNSKSNKTTWKIQTDDGVRTKPAPTCSKCQHVNFKSEVGETCKKCKRGEYKATKYQTIDLNTELNNALDTIDERLTTVGKIKGVERLQSDYKVPEPLEKGILRAKYDVSVFRDGTARYDMCDLPLTSFKPEEIDIPLEKVKELGYTKTVTGESITDESDLIEMKIQDVIINDDAAQELLDVANFIDDLLVTYYEEEPYYNADEPQDLIGKYIIGMAPHTSAGVVGRILGFTRASANYAHPFFHAAKRRNADGDEDSVMLLMDGLLNFSRVYLPSQRGKNMMDAPIVMSTIIDPEEIDDEAHNVDIVERYPLEFYKATMRCADPDEVDITLAEDVLDNPTNFKHSLSTTQLDSGPKLCSYKTLEGIHTQVDCQLDLANKTRAINGEKVASLIIEKHFFPDIIGNLTSFSRQKIQCDSCGQQFRRAPANGKCITEGCDGQPRPTIYEKMVTKYLETTKELAEEYSLKEYTKQRLDIMDVRVESIFEDDKEKQSEITDFF